MGVAGELYIAGAGLARGYLGRPGLTAERFVADPHDPEPGLGCTAPATWRGGGPTAPLEFLGRADQQVKLRGFRIEPGEIEAALTRAAGGGAGGGAGAGRRPGRQAPGRLRGGRSRSSARCGGPAPHVRPSGCPSTWCRRRSWCCEALPLTPNGKLDRKALPAPERRGEAYRARGLPSERVLCDLFAEILALPRVGIDDHFFELGGHSLLVMRLSSEIAKAFKQDHPLSLIYRYPTAQQLAAVLGQGARRMQRVLTGGHDRVRPAKSSLFLPELSRAASE